MPPRAVFRVIAAPLASEWGYKVAVEKFGRELVDSIPRIPQGKNTGKVSSYLCFVKCEKGGWASHAPLPQFPIGGGVIYRGTSDWRIALRTQHEDPHGHSTVARWTTGKQGPAVERLQSPEEAAALFRAYGQNPSFA